MFLIIYLTNISVFISGNSFLIISFCPSSTALRISTSDEFLSDHVEVLFMRMSVLGRNINPVLSILPDKFYLRPRLLQESLRTGRLLLRRFKEKYTAESCGSVLTDLYRRFRSRNRTIQTLSSKTVIEDRIR